MKKVMLAITLISLFGCEKETCPKGSYEWNDAQGNLIDCIDLEIPNYSTNGKKDIAIQVKTNDVLKSRLELFK